jgi:sugar-specific transcriptional regulator TrmB/DNA-binding CsgD family transcriptional regulator
VFEFFGVEPSVEAVYLAMLERPDAGIPDISQYLRVSDQDVYAAMDELARLALVRPSWENPEMMRAVTPSIGVESLFAQQHNELIQRQRRLEEGRASLAALVAQHEASRPDRGGGQVEEIRGLDAVREYLERLTAEVRFEVWSMMPDGAQTSHNLEASRPLDQSLLDRAVEIRSLYQDSIRNDTPSIAYARWIHEQGSEVRTVPVLPLRLIIIDRRIAIVPLGPGEDDKGIAALHGFGAVSAMVALFELTWQSAVPLGKPRSRKPETLGEQERVLLRLLAQGDTDEVVARKLGVSSRTVGRTVAELCERLGARSRFQAGVRSSERGWLATPENTPTQENTATDSPEAESGKELATG